MHFICWIYWGACSPAQNLPEQHRSECLVGPANANLGRSTHRIALPATFLGFCRHMSPCWICRRFRTPLHLCLAACLICLALLLVLPTAHILFRYHLLAGQRLDRCQRQPPRPPSTATVGEDRSHIPRIIHQTWKTDDPKAPPPPKCVDGDHQSYAHLLLSSCVDRTNRGSQTRRCYLSLGCCPADRM